MLLHTAGQLACVQQWTEVGGHELCSVLKIQALKSILRKVLRYIPLSLGETDQTNRLF